MRPRIRTIKPEWLEDEALAMASSDARVLRPVAVGYSTNGIPTVYRGVRFRSRLEARYATFFDLVEWPWRYEPIDLNGYIPDFILHFDAGDVLAEIKPSDVTRVTRDKICDSGWTGEAVVMTSYWADECGPHPSPGAFAEAVRDVPGETHAWGAARLATCISCGKVTIVSEDYSWRCRVCGEDGGNGHLGAADMASAAWLSAANRVQWRAS